MFLVGVSMPLSYSRRRARGDSWLRLFGHALFRSLILVALAVFLASNGSTQTNYSFTNVLGQIGLGYTFVFLVLGRPPSVQLAVAVLILFADWLLFALYPLPGPEFPYGLYGANETQLLMNGFFAHWNKNTNVAAAFDRWFLNLFPHPSNDPFRFNPGGYATLNFIPSIATMIFGVLAGELLMSKTRPHQQTPHAALRRRRLLDARPTPRRDGLPHRQADLDPILGHRLDRLDLLDAGGLLLGDRRLRIQALVAAAGRRGRQFDRDLPDGPAHEAVRGCLDTNSLRPRHLRRAQTDHSSKDSPFWPCSGSSASGSTSGRSSSRSECRDQCFFNAAEFLGMHEPSTALRITCVAW